MQTPTRVHSYDDKLSSFLRSTQRPLDRVITHACTFLGTDGRPCGKPTAISVTNRGASVRLTQPQCWEHAIQCNSMHAAYKRVKEGAAAAEAHGSSVLPQPRKCVPGDEPCAMARANRKLALELSRFDSHCAPGRHARDIAAYTAFAEGCERACRPHTRGGRATNMGDTQRKIDFSDTV